MELPRHLELSATTFTDEDRDAVIMAFREHIPIIIRRADETEFARMLPNDETEIENDAENTSTESSNT